MSDSDNEHNDKNRCARYGNPIIGVWRCPDCRYECFPINLKEARATEPFQCPLCGAKLYYDEEE